MSQILNRCDAAAGLWRLALPLSDPWGSSLMSNIPQQWSPPFHQVSAMAKPEYVCLTDPSLAIASLCRLVSWNAHQVSKTYYHLGQISQGAVTNLCPIVCMHPRKAMNEAWHKQQALRHGEIFFFDNYLVLKLNFIQKMLVKMLDLLINMYRNLAPCSGLLINDFLVNLSYGSRSKTTKRMDRSSYYPKSYSKPLYRHSERSPGGLLGLQNGFCCVSILLSTLWLFVCTQPHWLHH